MSVAGPILLSSSPPRLFTHSPIPVAAGFSSPSSPFLGDIFASQTTQISLDLPSQTNEKPTFKASNKVRSGFGGGVGISTPKLLAAVVGGENIPIQKPIPGLERPAKSVSKSVVANRNRPKTGQTERCDDELRDVSSKKDYDRSHSGLTGPQTNCLSPIRLEKATSRRRDWTPPSSPDGSGDEKAASRISSVRLFQSFQYKPTSQNSRDGASQPESDVSSFKRRKLDMTKDAHISTPTVPAKPKLMRVQPIKGKKSAKSTLTITGLATAKYNTEREQDSLMRQFLSATQQESQDSDTQELFNAAMRQKSARQVTRSKRAGKATVQSPQSAMAAFEGQDPLFGSASQLARDESPTLIRDTIEAMRLSEQTSFVSARPSSPITILTSEPADTPKQRQKRGIYKFVKTKNLWSAAGRDQDNALLQVDTIDLFDSPDIRNALAGKDVLLEPVGPRREGRNSRNSGSLSSGPVSRPLPSATNIIDVDDAALATPCASRSRPPITYPKPTSNLKTANGDDKSPEQISEASRTILRPVKPSYLGFTDNELASQLRSYGFKPIKNRTKMIDTLNRCWDNQHPPQAADGFDTTVPKQHPVASNVDHLTKVHDISSRPVPKTKKPPIKRKGSTVAGTTDSKRAAGTEGSKSSKARKRKGDEPVGRKGPVKQTSSMASLPRTKPGKSAAAAAVAVVASTCPNATEMSNDNTGPSKPATEIVAIPPVFSPGTATLKPNSPPILAAILSQPRNPNSASNPTFHQQLLTYTPIALEELTGWLNSGGLGAVGWDGEVAVAEVREWCEGVGGCCFGMEGGWRANRGKGKKANGGE